MPGLKEKNNLISLIYMKAVWVRINELQLVYFETTFSKVLFFLTVITVN